MAQLGAIKNDTKISLGEVSGRFCTEEIPVVIKIEYADEEFTSFPDFVAYALNKGSDQVTADDYFSLVIEEFTWGKFRKHYVRLLIEVLLMVVVITYVIQKTSAEERKY